MKRITSKTIALLMAVLGITSCVDDVYDPSKGKGEENTDIKPAEEYFDFTTRAEINLNVSLGTLGAYALIEVYTEFPYEASKSSSYAKKNVEAIFKIYADKNGNWNGNITLPKAVTTLYLCPNNWGLPVCETVEVKNGNASYAFNVTRTTGVAKTRSVSSGEAPVYTVDAGKQMYSLCQWGEHGNLTAPAGYIQDAGLDVAWIKSIQRTFWNGQDERPFNTTMDNSKFITDAAHVNTTIAQYAQNGDGTTSTITEASVYFTFLEESAWNQNTIGYYYYPKDQVPSSLDAVKKFIIFPNVSTAGNVPFVMQDYENEKYASPASGTSQQWLYKKADAPLALGNKVKLLFQKEDGTVTDKFPAGYTIGYFMISNGYGNGYGYDHTPNDVNLNPGNMGNLGYIYSNQAWNASGRSSFVAITDTDTGRVVYGIEDGTDKSYEDMLFYVEADPKGAIYDPERPVIPPVEDDRTVTELYIGTLLFEDIWPTGGDYDMNDVIIEYTRAVTFDKNNIVTKIADTFTPVWDGASYQDAFAYQTDAAQVGQLALPEGATYESETHSIVVFPNAKAVHNKEFTIVRTFNNNLDKKELKAYNPYIIVHYEPGAKNRQEVHLPKQMATDYADKSLNYTEDDAYYIRRDGKYPFAMDIPVQGFVPVTERSSIGMEGEYPGFTKWVNGEPGNEDWYNYKN
jgi:LruC domain-containing protein